MTTALSSGGSTMDPRYRGLSDMLRGLLERQRGDPAAALQSANASLAAMAGGANRKHLYEHVSLDLAARAALALGRAADGEHFARQSLSVAEAVARATDTSANVGEALLLIAKAEIAQGRAPYAQALLERAARCLTNGLGPNPAMPGEARPARRA